MRSYGDRCGVARALDVVGERWALLVARELLLGPKRFTDLRAGLRNVGPDMLAQRLRELEQAGVVRRRTLPPPAGSRVYELTDRGRELEPVVLALGRWGSSAPFPAEGARLGVDSFVLALKTLFEPGDGADSTVALEIAGQPFRARISGERFEVERGEADDATATIAGEPGPLAAWLWHGGPDDAITIEGDRDAAARFAARFPLGR
jgi:DNA-binding HxlR family transcriptional regulator